jgi:hypothetical protein
MAYNPSNPNGSATSANSSPVVIASDQSNLPENLKQVNGTTVDTNSGSKSGGTLRVVIATDQPSLSNAQPVSQSGTWTLQPGNTPNTSPWLITQNPATSGGLSIYTGSIGATATSVKSSAGQVYGWYIFNSNSSTVYVQIFNVASGSVTLGTTSPTMSLGIPAGAAANVEFVNGIAFGTAITVAVTTARAGGTGPSNTVDLNILYK